MVSFENQCVGGSAQRTAVLKTVHIRGEESDLHSARCPCPTRCADMHPVGSPDASGHVDSKVLVLYTGGTIGHFHRRPQVIT